MLQRKVNIHLSECQSTSELNDSLLMLAASADSTAEMIKPLLVAKGDVNAVDSLGMTPLLYAAQERNAKIARLLLDQKADPTLKNLEGKNALHLLFKKGKPYGRMVKKLIDAKADVDAEDKKQQTPIMKAISAEDEVSALLMIKQAKQLDILDELSRNALWLAIYHDLIDVVEALVNIYKVKITHPIMLEMMLNKHDPLDPRILRCFNVLNTHYADRRQAAPPLTIGSAPEVVVIQLVADRDNTYLTIPVNEIIDLVEARIYEICQLLEEEKPHATWMIVMHEYAINTPTNSKDSATTVSLLHHKMRAINKCYPNLIIIPGSMLTYEQKQITDIPSVLAKYDALAYIQNLEEKLFREENRHLIMNRGTIEKIQQKDLSHDTPMTAVSNTAFVFSEKEVISHVKTQPFYETSLLPDQFAVYAVGNVANIFTVTKKVSAALSICLEQRLPEIIRMQEKKTAIHFILSNTTVLELQNICATDRVIHVDAVYDPVVIIPRKTEQKSEVEVNVYAFDVMEKIVTLGHPLKAHYPAQFAMLDCIDECIAKLKDKTQKAFLISLKNDIMSYLPCYDISKKQFTDFLGLIGILQVAYPKLDRLFKTILAYLEDAKYQLTFNLPFSQPVSPLSMFKPSAETPKVEPKVAKKRKRSA